MGIFQLRCSNVQLMPFAVGEEAGEEDLFLVEGSQDWCNSLRPPTVDEPTKTVRVSVQRLDDALAELEVSKVDFIKVDAEGAELYVLYGVMRLLLRKSRPAILAEVQDVRTLPWGYAARVIIQFMVRMDYRWFAIAAKGALCPFPAIRKRTMRIWWRCRRSVPRSFSVCLGRGRRIHP